MFLIDFDGWGVVSWYAVISHVGGTCNNYNNIMIQLHLVVINKASFYGD